MTGTLADEEQVALQDLRPVGILGGTFNPPHLGHVALARHARDELGLEQVLLMPTHRPPHKHVEDDPGPEHRLAMCRLLAEGNEGLSACGLEVGRGGASYTEHTLRELRASHPDCALTFVVGADCAITMPTWREPVALFELADLAVGARAGSEREQVQRALAPVIGTASVSFLNAPLLPVSSSRARERAARGEPIDNLVGGAVAGYVAAHRLYRSTSPART